MLVNDHRLLAKLHSLLADRRSYQKLNIAEILHLSEEEFDSLLLRFSNLCITFHENKGILSLDSSLNLLEKALIEKNLSSTALSRLVLHAPYLSVNSTNKIVRELASKSPDRWHACVTEHQSAGRGRQGKVWVAPIGKNIIMSLSIKLDSLVADVGLVSLLVGISLVNALEDLNIVGLKIKWPNDIYWGDSKLAGILIESIKILDGDVRLIVGIGLNVELEHDEGKRIDQSYTDLKRISGASHCRNKLIARILNQLTTNFDEFQRARFNGFKSEWARLDYLSEKTVILTGGNHDQVVGVAKGVNEQGHLLVQADDRLLTILSGDVSVRRRMR